MPAIQRISDHMALADIVAFDRDDKPILIVAAEEQEAGPIILASYLEVLKAIRRDIPFVILADAEQSMIYRKVHTRSLEPISPIPTRNILSFYDPHFEEGRASKGYIVGMIDAWLRDFMNHWKSPTPPASETIAAVGLAARLSHGRLKRRVRLACLPVRGDELPGELRDGADFILRNRPESLQLIMPSVCFMESLSVFNEEEKRHRKRQEFLDLQLREVGRNITSSFARSVSERLNQIRTDTDILFQEYKLSLFTALEILARDAELIHPTTDIWLDRMRNTLIEDQTDNLILSSILHHAGSHSSEEKIFLSENRKDFEANTRARLALRGAGIRYFADASKCLEWHQAQAGS